MAHIQYLVYELTTPKQGYIHSPERMVSLIFSNSIMDRYARIGILIRDHAGGNNGNKWWWLCPSVTFVYRIQRSTFTTIQCNAKVLQIVIDSNSKLLHIVSSYGHVQSPWASKTVILTNKAKPCFARSHEKYHNAPQQDILTLKTFLISFE